MDNRKWQAAAIATPPTPPASPSVGYPTNGSLSQQPTTPGDWWYHQIGEELRNVILAAGLTPDQTKTDQLLLALKGGFGLTKNLATPGYNIFAGGLIMQWGIASASVLGGATLTNTLPLAFPTAGLLGFAGYSLSTPGAAMWSVSISFPSSSQIKFANATGSASLTPHYLAIGY